MIQITKQNANGLWEGKIMDQDGKVCILLCCLLRARVCECVSLCLSLSLCRTTFETRAVFTPPCVHTVACVRMGQVGHFPFVMVELVDSGAYDEELQEAEVKFNTIMEDIYGNI